MADVREVFTIVEDNTTGEGIKLPGRAQGDAAGSNHMPAMVAKDSSGNYELIEQRLQGQAASLVGSLPVLPVKDLAGDLQLINARDEGNAISGVDALPALIAKKAGNFAYLNLNADGELLIAANGAGIKKYGYAKVTPSAINTLTTVVDVVLTASKAHEEIEWSGSCSFSTMWEIVKIDDAGGTPVIVVLYSALSGPGQFHVKEKLEHMEFSSSATGIQKLRLRATQLVGSASDMHGYVAAIEKG